MLGAGQAGCGDNRVNIETTPGTVSDQADLPQPVQRFVQVPDLGCIVGRGQTGQRVGIEHVRTIRQLPLMHQQ